MIKPRIGLDWDDVTAPFNSIAIRMANKKYNLNLTLEDIPNWENVGKASVIKEFYMDPELYRLQKPTEETIHWVRELMRIGDVYFVSGVDTAFMSVRAKQILTAFPELPPSKIILGSAKNLISFDILLDDNIYNFIDNCADYKVVLRKPWNKEMTGMLSARDMEEFYCLVKQILFRQNNLDNQRPYVVTLVGPSGSGKNKLCQALAAADNRFVIPQNYTTNPNNQHTYISEDSWKHMNLFEDTCYGGYRYGTKKDDIQNILCSGKYPVIPLDMCGAITMKKAFPTKIIYISQGKKNLIKNILMKENLSYDEKVLRLISIDAEKKNQDICDVIYENDANKSIEEFINCVIF